MKKLNYLLLGAAGLLMASCSQEDVFTPSSGDSANITLSLTAPSLQTRAFSDGGTATKLQYAIYEMIDDEPVYRADYVYNQDFVKSASITVNVAKGHTYNVVFWASAKTVSPYTVDFETAPEVTVDYSQANSNDENLDAFFGMAELKDVKGDAQLSVTLKRPFAQINVGTNDYEAFKNVTGNDVTSTSISVNKAYTKLNLLNGAVSDPKDGVKFAAGTMPVVTENFPKEGYNYLAMVYLLADTDSENYNITYGYTETGKTEETKTVADVPVQRNHRTNLYGNLLTGKYDILVDKEPGLDDDDNDEEVVNVPDGMVRTEGVNYDSLKTALQAAADASNTNPVIYVGETKENNPIIINDEFVFSVTRATPIFESINIKGSGAKENIVFQFNDGDSMYGSGVLNFENITMRRMPSDRYQNDSDKGPWFINIAQENYKDCNIEGCVGVFVTESASFENCNFKNTETSGFKANGIYYYAGDKTKVYVNNCTFDMMGKGILVYSSGKRQMDLTVENSVFNSSKIDTDKAAIQIQSEKDCYGNVIINNVKATGYQAKNGGLWDEIDNTTGKDKNNYNISVDGEVVQATSFFVVDEVWYNTASEAFKAIQNNSVLEFGSTPVAANTVTWPTDKTVTIIGKGAKFSNINNIEWQAVTGCDLTIKDLSIDVLIRTTNHTSMGFKGMTKSNFENVVFNGEWHTFDGPQIYTNCTFNYNAASDALGKGRYNIYNYANAETHFIGCTFNAKDTKALLVYDMTYEGSKQKHAMSDLWVESCSFFSSNNPTSSATAHACVEIHEESFNTYATVTINHATIENGKFTYRGLWYDGDNTTFGASLTGPGKKTNCRIIVDGEVVQQGKI